MATSNDSITMKGKPLKVEGKCLEVGSPLPDFKLTANDLSDVTRADYTGKILVVVAVPSLDTPVCALETKRFNKEATNLSKDVTIVVVSRDLPFAQKRWCGAEGVSNVVALSDHKYRTFGKAFGVELPELGLLARAVFVSDRSGKIVHVDYVSEVAEEPDYSGVLSAVEKAI